MEHEKNTVTRDVDVALNPFGAIADCSFETG
jgi:hypothetical protein